MENHNEICNQIPLCFPQENSLGADVLISVT